MANGSGKGDAETRRQGGRERRRKGQEENTGWVLFFAATIIK
jgi:hypothetical protein